MSNKKQSSVEYYSNKLIEILGDDIVNKLSIEQTNRIHYLVKESTAMHKEEIKNAYVEGLTTSIDNPFLPPNEYYNETYGE